jgi:hypothetical protein
MRGKPLDLNETIKKISAVSWEPWRRAMEKGWVDIWRREWVFLWVSLENNSDPRAVNIRRKLCGGYSQDGTKVKVRNKLYLTKAEQPWLIEWIREQCDKGKDWKFFS